MWFPIICSLKYFSILIGYTRNNNVKIGNRVDVHIKMILMLIAMQQIIVLMAILWIIVLESIK